MDVAKTRLQVISQNLKGQPKPSLVNVMSDILAKDGIGGLYAGS
jgi:Mitochondrial carrier protein